MLIQLGKGSLRAGMQQVCINFIRTFSVAVLWPLNCSARMELLWLCHFGTILPKASTLLPLKDWVVGGQTGCQNNLGLMGLFDVTSPAHSFTFKCQLEAGLLNPPVLDIVNFGKAPGKVGVVFFLFFPSVATATSRALLVTKLVS